VNLFAVFDIAANFQLALMLARKGANTRVGSGKLSRLEHDDVGHLYWLDFGEISRWRRR
jgi:hypothetical protein